MTILETSGAGSIKMITSVNKSTTGIEESALMSKASSIQPMDMTALSDYVFLNSLPRALPFAVLPIDYSDKMPYFEETVSSAVKDTNFSKEVNSLQKLLTRDFSLNAKTSALSDNFRVNSNDRYSLYLTPN